MYCCSRRLTERGTNAEVSEYMLLVGLNARLIRSQGSIRHDQILLRLFTQ